MNNAVAIGSALKSARTSKMAVDLDALRFEDSADVYKAGVLAGGLERTEAGAIAFAYTPDYAEDPANPAVASTLPLSSVRVAPA